jgi:hypothetical protein
MVRVRIMVARLGAIIRRRFIYDDDCWIVAAGTALLKEGDQAPIRCMLATTIRDFNPKSPLVRP